MITKLNSGHTIPSVGFGTYLVDPKDTKDTVALALYAGYRHIDTAQMYGNEAGVGDALVETATNREAVFITTKLNNGNHEPDVARRTFAESLEKLQTDYVDLFLIHWPLKMHYNGDFVSTYKVMEEFVADGRARSIGVSNFQIAHLEELLEATDIVPAVNQIELHPYFQNRELANFCQEKGIAVESWSPLGRGKELEDPVIKDIAGRIGAKPSQVVLAWHRSKGYITIPKSSNRERQVENLDSLNVTLSDSDIAAIDALDKGEEGRQGPNPDTFAKI